MIAHIPWETVVWAIVALALAATLYCVLGRKIGAQGVRQPRLQLRKTTGPAVQQSAVQPPPLPGSVGTVEKPTEYVVAEAARGPLPQLVASLPGFSAESFLRQTESLFRDVVAAYVRDDREFLAQHVTPSVLDSFTNVLDRLKQEGLKPQARIQRIERVALECVTFVPDLEDPSALMCCLKVEITSWQKSNLTDSKGEVVEGTEALTEFHDVWDLTHLPGAEGASKWRVAGTAAH